MAVQQEHVGCALNGPWELCRLRLHRMWSGTTMGQFFAHGGTGMLRVGSSLWRVQKQVRMLGKTIAGLFVMTTVASLTSLLISLVRCSLRFGGRRMPTGIWKV